MNSPLTFTLTGSEIEQIHDLLTPLCNTFDCAEHPDLVDQVVVIAQEMPRRLRQFLYQFKLYEQAPACLISGFPIDDESIGHTPSHWTDHEDACRTKSQQILFLLCGALLGETFGWLTQQNGYLIHDVLPIKSDAHEQIGSGSEALLLWHTEDAYHPARGDYVGLMCLRNPCHAVTTIGAVDSLKRLSSFQLEILRQPRFTFRPDNAHQPQNNYQHQAQSLDKKILNAYGNIKLHSQSQTNLISVLYGEINHPYLCVDPAYMEAMDSEARAALNALINAIDKDIIELELQPGDICFIDNFRAVHGRKPFRANYDGHDRWLKRINITRDLRKSSQYRSHIRSRIIDLS